MDVATDALLKRKRSPSVSGAGSPAPPPAKTAKTTPATTAMNSSTATTTTTTSAAATPHTTTNHNQLSINYLARHSAEDLPLINKEESLPNLLQLLSSYSAVLDRHESLASNLGARPLGPILIKRFERCFDAPPRIVAAHSKGVVTSPSADDSSHSITWLEVIEFARSHPAQFTLTSFSEGSRVCQFYYPQKQLRVQVSEEDFLFINSGRCQELIPPLPIWEDEEKEFNTCDLLEAKLKELTNVADMVAARTRQLSHRLKGRKAAIQERRAEGGSGTPAKASAPQTTTAPPGAGGVGLGHHHHQHSNALPRPINDSSGASLTQRSELLKHFESLPHNQHPNHDRGGSGGGGHAQHQHRPSIGGSGGGGGGGGGGGAHSRHPSIAAGSGEHLASYGGSRHHDSTGAHHERTSNASSMSPGPSYPHAAESHSYGTSHDRGTTHSGSGSHPSQHRPGSSAGASATKDPFSSNNNSAPLRHNFSRPLPPALESSQPFRPLCQAHMDSLPRGHRVLPPCDRCRRLRMDCVKNLTSCAGCTRKHARCHWRDVRREELVPLDVEGAVSRVAEELRAKGRVAPLVSQGPDVEGLPGGGGKKGGKRNGVVNGEMQEVGGLGSEEEEQEEEDEEDDDSNPLEDLEALGQKEELESQAREAEGGVGAGAIDSPRRGESEGNPGAAAANEAERKPAESEKTAPAVIVLRPDPAAAEGQRDPGRDTGAPPASNTTTTATTAAPPSRHSYDPVHDGEHPRTAPSQQQQPPPPPAVASAAAKPNDHTTSPRTHPAALNPAATTAAAAAKPSTPLVAVSATVPPQRHDPPPTAVAESNTAPVGGGGFRPVNERNTAA